MSGLFVTGTDTNIGKTLVSAILASKLQYNYWKPIQTGSVEGTDSAFIKTIIDQRKVYSESYCFPDPLSPNHAASLAGTEIDLQKILLDWSKCPRPVIVEGAGGLLVPINHKEMIVDLIDIFKLPTVLVARSELGTLNHTFLSVEYLRKRNIPIVSIILSGELNTRNANSIYEETKIPVVSIGKIKSFQKKHEYLQNIDIGGVLNEKRAIYRDY